MNAHKNVTSSRPTLVGLLPIWLGQLALIELNELGLLHQVVPAPSDNFLAWEACNHAFTLGLCTVFVLTSLMVLAVGRWKPRPEPIADVPASS